jgi:hypothetical protein
VGRPAGGQSAPLSANLQGGVCVLSPTYIPAAPRSLRLSSLLRRCCCTGLLPAPLSSIVGGPGKLVAITSVLKVV